MVCCCKKKYELGNHLGNVRVVISDLKVLNDVDVSNTINAGDYFSPDVVSFSDYYPFGALLPGRNANSADYRYGFNGMEKDDEVKSSTGTSYTSFWRSYDPRLGRWLSIDPLAKNFPGQSPYVAFDNNPIALSDPHGNCTTCPKNDHGAPVAGAGDLTDESFPVSAGTVGANAKNDFKYRSEDNRQGYNYYWVPDGGEYGYDEDGNTVKQGAYYATPYVHVEQSVMTTPGSPAIPAVAPTAGTPAQFGWVPGASGQQQAPLRTAGTTGPGSAPSAGDMSSFFIPLDQTRLTNLQSQDAANGPALTNSNYVMNLTFAVSASNSYTQAIVTAYQGAGFNVNASYDPSGSFHNFGGNARFNRQITYTQTPSAWQQTAPAVPPTPGAAAVPAVAPTFTNMWNWVPR